MAVRTPLYNDGGNLKEMTSTMITNIKKQIVYQYSLNPSVALSVVSSGGSLGTISDTRTQAGAYTTRVDRFATEAETANISTVTVNYSKINQSLATVSPTSDTGKTWPVYYTSGGHIQPMTLQDVKDTFLHPAIDLLVSGSTGTDQAGTYFISTATSVSGATRVSATPVFTDTRANSSLYTAAGIPETLDQPQTINNYYLYVINGSDTAYTQPLFVRSDNSLQIYPNATFESLVQEWIRYTAASSTDGYSVRYSYSSGTNRGSGMVNTILNGSSASGYTQYQVNANDYRTQEFPNGTAVTADTYYLKINKS